MVRLRREKAPPEQEMLNDEGFTKYLDNLEQAPTNEKETTERWEGYLVYEKVRSDLGNQLSDELKQEYGQGLMPEQRANIEQALAREIAGSKEGRVRVEDLYKELQQSKKLESTIREKEEQIGNLDAKRSKATRLDAANVGWLDRLSPFKGGRRARAEGQEARQEAEMLYGKVADIKKAYQEAEASVTTAEEAAALRDEKHKELDGLRERIHDRYNFLHDTFEVIKKAAAEEAFKKTFTQDSRNVPTTEGYLGNMQLDFPQDLPGLEKAKEYLEKLSSKGVDMEGQGIDFDSVLKTIDEGIEKKIKEKMSTEVQKSSIRTLRQFTDKVQEYANKLKIGALEGTAVRQFIVDTLKEMQTDNQIKNSTRRFAQLLAETL